MTNSHPRILLCNDDGVWAPGLKILERIARTLTPDVWVVAPEHEQSGKAMSLTFHKPLRIDKITPRKFSVQGSPADCVVMAINHILVDKKPDLVLSGINNGQNVGDIVYISGTVGAAQMASFHGIKSIAISVYSDFELPLDYNLPEQYLPQIIKKLNQFAIPERHIINVNFPNVGVADCPGIKVVQQGHMKIEWNIIQRSDPVGRPYYWVRSNWISKSPEIKNDVNSLYNGKYITITPLELNYNNPGTLNELEELFNSH